MMSLLLAITATLVGLALLVKSADVFVDGCIKVATAKNISPIIVGAVIIGFGTSAPEILVAISSAIEGVPELGIGSALGSNVANIGFILGVSALIAPLTFPPSLVRRDLVALILCNGLLVWMWLDLDYARTEAFILLALFLALTIATIKWPAKGVADSAQTSSEESTTEKLSARVYIFICGSLAVLLFSADLLVWGAVELASAAGVDEIVIGLTIVAFGTSLPELAAAIASLKAKRTELVVGNVLGSNMLNTLVAIGMAGAIQPHIMIHTIIERDAIAVGAVTFLLFLLVYRRNGQGTLKKFGGVLLLLSYAVYISWIALSTLGEAPL